VGQTNMFNLPSSNDRCDSLHCTVGFAPHARYLLAISAQVHPLQDASISYDDLTLHDLLEVVSHDLQESLSREMNPVVSVHVSEKFEQ